MATQNTNYGTRASYPSVSNLNSLASGNGCCIGAIDNSSTKALGGKVDITLTFTGTPSATGSVAIYLLESADGTNYTDGLSATLTSTAVASIARLNARQIASLATAATASLVLRATLDLPKTFCPLKHTLLIVNSGGAALNSSGNDVEWTPITFTVA